MLSEQIRSRFLSYFKKKGHALVPSSPVFPHDDPTLLFINAGMNQFKDVFLGQSHRDYSRATSSQKCIRVGGKHNDLENVGHTSRHLTFFEMLGNFSFGDYFKKEAIQYAWEVSTEVFEFAPQNIWPTVFIEDEEAFELWKQYVPAERITRFGEKENFWMMGEIGPCGPCSELLFDRGEKFGSAQNPAQDPAGNRFLEFWNLVFMQYNKQQSAKIELLPKPSIDTGVGLERVAALKMGVDSVYETDVLRLIISKIEEVSKVTYRSSAPNAAAFRVISDHLRCLSFAIADGVQPGNSDRGYVLRKVLRRAVRYGRQLGLEKPFLADILPALLVAMGQDYPELLQGKNRIVEILTSEEEAFLRTLRRGGNILTQVMDKAHQTNGKITGEDAFKLKDTYGLPYEEIALMAKDSSLFIDEKRYQQLEKEAKERSRQVHKGAHQEVSKNIYQNFVHQFGPTTFVGYEELEVESEVIALFANGQFIDTMSSGEKGTIFLKTTPFYAEMGGQVGDVGALESRQANFQVTNCTSPYKGLVAHKGELVAGSIQVGNLLTAKVNKDRRQKIANNHTATHLLHWALHELLGEQIKQAGSLVDAQKLRFDFSYHKSLTLEEIDKLEDLVNEKIRQNLPVKNYEISFEEAQHKKEIKQFFGEKYGHMVRVVDIDYSKELCGGTHACSVGSLGLFRIAKESSISAGIRRIEAVTGKEAEQLGRNQEKILLEIAQELKVPANQMKEKVVKINEENRHLQRELKKLKKEQLDSWIEQLILQKKSYGTCDFLIAHHDLSIEELKYCLEKIHQQLANSIVILATTLKDRCQIMVQISESCLKRGISARDLLERMLPIVEGSGGGKATMAQGGGKAPEKLEEAFLAVRSWLTEKLL